MSKMKGAPWVRRAAVWVVAFSFSAAIWAQERSVTLQVKNAKVEQALMELRKTSGYKFLFNHEEVEKAGRKTVDLKKRPLAEVLDALLKGTGLTYRIEKNVVVIVPVKRSSVQPAKRKVTGTVTDANGEPLPGVAVMYDATQTGTTTDIDGHFAIEVPEQSGVSLSVSMMGMKPLKVAVGKQRELRVVMVEDSKMLSDVVVTGYQTISKERSAGSFSVLSGTEVNDKATLRGNIMESLEGMTTGLSVNYGEGQEKFLIRGMTSINSTRSPLS